MLVTSTLVLKRFKTGMFSLTKEMTAIDRNSKTARESSSVIGVYANVRQCKLIYTDTIMCDFSDHIILITDFVLDSPLDSRNHGHNIKSIDYGKIVDFVNENLDTVAQSPNTNTQDASLRNFIYKATQHATILRE